MILGALVEDPVRVRYFPLYIGNTSSVEEPFFLKRMLMYSFGQVAALVSTMSSERSLPNNNRGELTVAI